MDLSINTFQNININYKPAGLANRIGATCIDFLILGAFLIGANYLINFLSVDYQQKKILLIIVLILLTFYHFICELTLNGQSIGKMTLHLRVVRLDGQKLSFWDCMLRWVFRLLDISGSIGSVAIASIAISSKLQRLGDLAAGTTVIKENTSVSLEQINSFIPSDDYQVVFPQVVVLSDKDISILKEVLIEVEKNQDYNLLEPLAQKIKAITGAETNLNNMSFVQTVLKDYFYLTK